MLALLWHNLRWRKGRLALLVLGAAVLSTGLSYLAVLADNARSAVDQRLQEHWRTSYDILVRPSGSAGDLESEYDMVEANHLSGLRGGITAAQVAAIRAVPGVEVAAPVAILGHVYLPTTLNLTPPDEPGLYRVRHQVSNSDGVRTFTSTQTLYQAYYPRPLTDPAKGALGQQSAWTKLAELGVTPAPILSPSNSATKGPFYYRTTFGQLVLLAAVDPVAEAALVGLDKAIVSGRYLSGDDHAAPDPTRTTPVTQVPVLLSSLPASSLSWKTEFEALVPGEIDPGQLLTQIQQNSLSLDRLAATPQVAAQFDHVALLEHTKASLNPSDPRTTFASSVAPPSPLSYRKVESPVADWPLAIEAVPFGQAGPTYHFSGGGKKTTQETPRVAYRPSGEATGESMIFQLVGEFDSGKLSSVVGEGLNAVPMETYRPVAGVIRFDLHGSATSPKAVQPGDNPQDAFLTPPTLITTLDAASAVMKTDAVISAVRVRVVDSGSLSEAAQARVQIIAEQIRRQTGLLVDITLGSSPRRLLLKVPGWQEIPGLGYLEQPWVQKGAQILIHREMNKGNALLLIVVLAVGIVYVFATAIVSVLSRRRELALMSAIGWSPGTVSRSIMAEGVISALTTAIIGMTMAFLVGLAGKLHMPWDRVIFAGVVTASVYLIGTLGPAFLAGRTRPQLLLRQGETGEISGRLRVRSLLGLAVANAISRWRRNLLSLVAIAVPTALMGFLLFVTVRMKGILILTLVGDAILVQVGPTHLITLAVAFGMAVFTTADILWLNVAERRSELALVSALGWPRRTIRTAILIEGGVIGAVAGVLGMAVSMGTIAFFYTQQVLPLLPMSLALLLVPTITGVIGALIPAEVGVRVSPSEGLRTE